MSFSDPEGYIDSSDFPPQPVSNFLECTYNVTVYTGYGVELQVAPRAWHASSQVISWPQIRAALVGFHGEWEFPRACPTEA